MRRSGPAAVCVRREHAATRKGAAPRGTAPVIGLTIAESRSADQRITGTRPARG